MRATSRSRPAESSRVTDVRVRAGTGGDLGQMGDAQNLVNASDRLQPCADGVGRGAADTRIDFIEDQRAPSALPYRG
jgi:hypothetical protein